MHGVQNTLPRVTPFSFVCVRVCLGVYVRVTPHGFVPFLAMRQYNLLWCFEQLLLFRKVYRTFLSLPLSLYFSVSRSLLFSVCCDMSK